MPRYDFKPAEYGWAALLVGTGAALQFLIGAAPEFVQEQRLPLTVAVLGALRTLVGAALDALRPQ